MGLAGPPHGISPRVSATPQRVGRANVDISPAPAITRGDGRMLRQRRFAVGVIRLVLTLNRRGYYRGAEFIEVKGLGGIVHEVTGQKLLRNLEARTVSLSAFRIVRNTSAIETGFIAAGVTISIIAVIECLGIVLSWMGFSF